jgi:hypothetical protein
MIRTTVYDTQNYWGSGLCPSSRILKIRKHNVSETESVSDNGQSQVILR